MGAYVRPRLPVFPLFRSHLPESAQQVGPDDETGRYRFSQTANAFRQCSDPAALQKLADSLTGNDLLRCGHKWLSRLIPFFSPKERREAGCWHQLFFAQVEYCENLIFRRRTALDELGERLHDANRMIGRPDKLTVIYGRRVTKQYH